MTLMTRSVLTAFAILCLLNGCGGGSSGGSGRVYAVAADGSGGWYIGGVFSRIDGVQRNGIAHILPNGSLDPDFNPDSDGIVLAIVVSGDTVYAGGSFTMIGGEIRNNIAALDATSGLALADFNPDASGQVRSLTRPGGTLYVGGGFTIGGQHVGGVGVLYP